MELSAKEIVAIEQAVVHTEERQVAELTSLQLALIGGGCGEVLFG